MPILPLATELERLAEQGLSRGVAPSRDRSDARPVEQVGLVCRGRRHRERLLQERQRLRVGPKRSRALGRPAKGEPRLTGQCVGLGTLAGIGMGRQVMNGERSRQLVRPEGLEVPRRCEVPNLSIAA